MEIALEAQSYGGRFFDGKTSTSHDAKVHVHVQEKYLEVTWIDGNHRFAFQEIELIPRIPGTQGTLTFKSLPFAQFEFSNSNQYDALANLLGSKTWITWLESKWKIALSSLVAILILGNLFYFVALPRIAVPLAQRVPQSWSQRLSEATILFLEKIELIKIPANFVAPAHLDRASEIIQLDTRETVRLRVVESEIANAFALPDGQILVTTPLLEVLTLPEEIAAVLLHEIGHIHHHHGLRRAIQSSFLGLVVLMFAGADSNALVYLLMETGYSRSFEREADQFSMEQLTQLGLPNKNLGCAIQRLSLHAARVKKANPEHKQIVENNPLFNWVSSHPPIEERLIDPEKSGCPNLEPITKSTEE